VVKYSDCPSTEVDTYIAAPPSRVWQWVSDIQLPARFSAEFQGAYWIEENAGPCVGAQFVGRNQHKAIGKWETTSRIVECDPPRVFAWAVDGAAPDQPSAVWRFELTEEGEGTRLKQCARMGPGPSGLTPAIEAMPEKEERIIDRRLSEFRANMAATVAGIKELAEGEH
jgi:uncharacterized protein YndB with AHSA1/START domain